MTSTVIVTTRKRLIFAAYVDLLLFLVVWGIANFMVGGNAHFFAGVLVFVVIRFLTSKLKAAPGLYFLSIGRDRLIDPSINGRENWLTMLLGALFVLEGSKLLVNWTQGVIPEPFFGFMPSDTAQVTIDMLIGILLVFVGLLYFKLRVLGFWLALLTAVGGLVSIAVSWSLWTEAVPKVVLAGRAAQGRVPSAAELQFMQSFLPSMNVALLLCVLVAVLATHPRFFPRGFAATGPS
jgi:hypothetical protein